MKKLLIATWIVLLTACTSVPLSRDVESIRPIDRAAHERHQQQLSAITSWRLQGQIALFNRVEDSRDAIYIDWTQTADTTLMRFSHPLRGTVARLEQSTTGAVLIDDDQNEYYAKDFSSLLQTYFGIDLPVSALPDVVRGILPEQASAVQVMSPTPESTAAARPILVLNTYSVRSDEHQWQAELRNYQSIESIYLPGNIELTSADWRVKLRITDWHL